MTSLFQMFQDLIAGGGGRGEGWLDKGCPGCEMEDRFQNWW